MVENYLGSDWKWTSKHIYSAIGSSSRNIATYCVTYILVTYIAHPFLLVNISFIRMYLMSQLFFIKEKWHEISQCIWWQNCNHRPRIKKGGLWGYYWCLLLKNHGIYHSIKSLDKQYSSGISILHWASKNIGNGNELRNVEDDCQILYWSARDVNWHK